MKEWIFITTVAAELILGISLILTLLIPGFRIWPPPARKAWQYYFTWVLVDLSLLGIVGLGIMDWNSHVLAHWIRLIVGGVLITGGAAFALWAVHVLSVHTSLGLKGELVTSGPYRYSRNPQYVGDLAMLFGYILFTNSGLVAITALLGAAWFLLAPFVEEPWLRERFGKQYEDYLSDVPRFLGV